MSIPCEELNPKLATLMKVEWQKHVENIKCVEELIVAAESFDKIIEELINNEFEITCHIRDWKLPEELVEEFEEFNKECIEEFPEHEPYTWNCKGCGIKLFVHKELCLDCWRSRR